jgi:two-component system NtrC family sensor kinase
MMDVDLAQVVHNVIDNAIQAMPSGGILTVKTGLAGRGKNFVIDIRDQGVGIPKERLEHIFEPFFTTKARGIQKNSGLGLPIAYSLVKDVAGEMRVTSSLRKGTSVTISLPVYPVSRKVLQ